jgi:uncharacterized membrane protein
LGIFSSFFFQIGLFSSKYKRKMKFLKLGLTFLFGAFMVYAGINHFLKPAMYFPFFADFLPKEALNYAAGIAEIIAGGLVFIPKYRSYGTWGILALMIAFLPLHVADVFKENPAVGTHQIALIRLPFQFLFIAWAWFIHDRNVATL